LGGHQETIPDRRRWLRHKVHAPAFASFDGVTGGMILDLSDQGIAMQSTTPLEASRPVRLQLNLSDPAIFLETTGYVAWADALGRAGIRFSELPEEARLRLDEWLEHNASTPSRKVPTLTEPALAALYTDPAGMEGRGRRAISLEWDTIMAEKKGALPPSSTVQYEFNSLGSDLNAALRLIGARACSLTRGDSAAIALLHNGSMMCRASIGANAPALGARLDVNSGFSGECVRSGKALRCDDAEIDSRVNAGSCRRMAIRSILAAPIQYEREIVGLLEVLSEHPFAFDEGDVAVVERLAQTVLLAMRQVGLT
jgi:hypothetical protein